MRFNVSTITHHFDFFEWLSEAGLQLIYNGIIKPVGLLTGFPDYTLAIMTAIYSAV